MTRAGMLAVVVVACGDSTQGDGEASGSTDESTGEDDGTSGGSTSTSGADTTGVDATTTGSSSDEGETTESSSTGEPIGPPDECPSELTFTSTTFALPGGGTPFGVALFDADGIGGIDLAVTDVSSRVLVFRGVGDGTFTEPTTIDLGNDPQPQDLEAADFDGDGNTDLLVADMDGQSTFVRFWYGMGDRSFTEGPDVPVGARPADLQLGDYDGNGAQDFTVHLLENFTPSDVVIMLGYGDGTFTEAAELGVQGEPVAFASGDLDGDGAPDLLGVHTSTGEIVLRRNTGGGSFGDAGTLTYEPVGNTAAIADLDNDGIGEIVVSSGADDMPGGIHLWPGSATFDHGAPQQLAAITPIDTILAHDVSGDGWPDLVLGTESSSSSPGLWLLLTDPDGIGTCEFTVGITDNPRSFAAADIDDDGDQDLVTALGGAASSLAVLLQD